MFHFLWKYHLELTINTLPYQNYFDEIHHLENMLLCMILDFSDNVVSLSSLFHVTSSEVRLGKNQTCFSLVHIFFYIQFSFNRCAKFIGMETGLLRKNCFFLNSDALYIENDFLSNKVYTTYMSIFYNKVKLKKMLFKPVFLALRLVN